MPTFFFPGDAAPGVGCVNTSDCIGEKAACSVQVPGSNLTYCTCPRFYDPLTNCRKFYYDYDTVRTPLNYAFGILFILIGLIFLVIVTPYIVLTTKRWLARRANAAAPRPWMMIFTWMFGFIQVLSVTSGVLALAHFGVAKSIVTTIFTSMFALEFSILCINMCEMILLARDLKSMRKSWRIATLVLKIIGPGGLLLSLAATLFREAFLKSSPMYTLLTWVSDVGLVAGFGISIGISVVMSYKVSKKLNSDASVSEALLKIWRLVKILILLTLEFLFSYISIIVLLVVFPSQLFDAIVLQEYFILVALTISLATLLSFIIISLDQRYAVAMSSEAQTTPKTTDTGDFKKTPVNSATESTLEMELVEV